MKKVVNLDKKIDKSIRRNKIRRTFIAWKEAHTFLKQEEKHNMGEIPHNKSNARTKKQETQSYT